MRSGGQRSFRAGQPDTEHLPLEKRSDNMGPQLERLNGEMASATDPERFESLLQQLDEAMQRETQD